MFRHIGAATVVGPVIWLLAFNSAPAQTIPPTSPTPSMPEKSEKTIVVNPTEDECKKGWSDNLKWTKE